MAEIIGFFRENATYGEKETLKLLKNSLPKDFYVYVETPIHKKRDIRYPDFVVVTTYGVIVLEVKDWIAIERADPTGATIRMRDNSTRQEANPVNKARDFAITLANELNTKRNRGEAGEAIPWSYATVLINLPSSTITRLRTVWGEEFVFGKEDLSNSDLLLHRLKMTFPAERIRSLTRRELDLVRATIFPVVEIEIPQRPTIILDQQQEKIVAEPVRQESQTERTREEKREVKQDQLFAALQADEKKEEESLPSQSERISQMVSIRLVRGFSGSGKTLILTQRAKYLSAQYPEWKIAVLTYNKPLQEQLESNFRGTAITPRTFHSICFKHFQLDQNNETDLENWLETKRFQFPIITQLGHETLEDEFNWMRDVNVIERGKYLAIERRGAGKGGRLGSEQRNKLFDAFEEYNLYLQENGYWDWHDIPLKFLKMLELGQLTLPKYDAILVDEAQDWAPVWFQIVNHLLDPDHGLLFLADDPSQSIFRHFSWKEKAVNVVGRTRWLKVPYRNTYEIYNAAYALIADNPEVQSSLSEEGELVRPDVSSQEMRHGSTPLIKKCSSNSSELSYIKNMVDNLREEGLRDDQIAILVQNNRDQDLIAGTLRGYSVKISPMRRFKGLEMEAVILPYLHKTFVKPEDEANDRRLMYMAMTRARSHLYMTYCGRLPKPFGALAREALAEVIN
jgi:hypothetical protein